MKRRVWTVLGAAVTLGAASLAWPLPPSAGTTGPVTSVRVTASDGRLLREIRPDGRGTPVALANIPTFAQRTVVAVEDRRFYDHYGVDVWAIGRALLGAARTGEASSGASTLTMQVARNLRAHGQPEGRRTLTDKIAEAHLALRLELHRSKADLLALWFNRAYFGHGAYGLDAAARTYFGKTARDLTDAEAALLVGLPQRPSGYDPTRHPDAALRRRSRVLAAAVRAGVLDSTRAAALDATPLHLAVQTAGTQALHLAEQLGREAPAGTVEIRTTLDAPLQAAAEALVRSHLARLDADGLNASVLVVDNATGRVRAYVGSADYWDDGARGRIDGTRALRQPGSALKPFTYALALESRRYTSATILPDLEMTVAEGDGAFRPQNYDRQFHGPVPLGTALASSFNIPAVGLARDLGPHALLDALHRAGFASLTRSADVYGVGLTLGNGEVTLHELAAAYAGLARGGVRPTLRLWDWTRTAYGDTLAAAPPTGEPMGVLPETAFLIARILSDPDARAPGFGRGSPLELPFPVAVKTGTSKDYRDNWAVGFSPVYTVAVWVGFFDGRPMQHVSGVSGAGPLLNALFRELGPGGAFTMPPGVAVATVCPHSGKRPGRYCPSRKDVFVLNGTAPSDTCDVHRALTLDRRTGLLADAATPASQRERRVYTDYGARYHSWMQQHGLPLPPTASMRTANASQLVYSPRLRVEYPASGTRFLLDPHLRRNFQRLPLSATAETGLVALVWKIDGRDVGRGSTLDWPLVPGRHVAELHAVDESGQRVRSAPVEFWVE